MTAHVTKEWWICFSDQHGNVRHQPLGEWLGLNQFMLMEQQAEESLPVALASTLEGSQEAGRRFKRRIREKNAEHEPRAIASRAPCSCSTSK